MANELTLSASVNYSKGLSALSRAPSGIFTVTGTVYVSAVQTIGTAEETLALGEVSPSGYALFKNLDSTNYVQLGKVTATYVLRLKAGEFALARLEAWSSIFAKANTASVDLEYTLFSD